MNLLCCARGGHHHCVVARAGVPGVDGVAEILSWCLFTAGKATCLFSHHNYCHGLLVSPIPMECPIPVVDLNYMSIISIVYRTIAFDAGLWRLIPLVLWSFQEVPEARIGDCIGQLTS